MNTHFYAGRFAELTGYAGSPRLWQRTLADSVEFRSRLICISMRLGKTEAGLTAWMCIGWSRRILVHLPCSVSNYLRSVHNQCG